jgi:hypothetical protein
MIYIPHILNYFNIYYIVAVEVSLTKTPESLVLFEPKGVVMGNPALLTILFLAYGGLASTPTVSPFERLPIGSLETARVYATNQVTEITMTIHRETSLASGDWSFYWAGRFWCQIDVVWFYYPTNEELGVVMSRELGAYLTNRLSLLVGQSNQPANTVFMAQSIAGDHGTSSYFWIANQFSLVSTGDGYAIPPHAFAPTFVDWHLAPQIIRIKAPGVKRVIITRTNSGQSVECVDSAKVSNPYAYGALVIDPRGIISFPLRFAEGGIEGTARVCYSFDGCISETFDLATGNKILDNPVVRFERSTNSFYLLCAGALPSRVVAVESSTNLVNWQQVMLITNYNGLAWLTNVPCSRRVEFFRLRAP